MALGVIRLRALADKQPNGMRLRTIRRLLQNRQRQLQATLPNEAPLLIQPVAGGDYYADIAQLRKHLPGLIIDDPEDQLAALRRQVEELLELATETKADTSEIRLRVTG